VRQPRRKALPLRTNENLSTQDMPGPMRAFHTLHIFEKQRAATGSHCAAAHPRPAPMTDADDWRRTASQTPCTALTHTDTHTPGVYPGSCRSSDFPMRASRTHRLSRRGPPKSVKIWRSSTIFTLFHRIYKKIASAHRLFRRPPPSVFRPSGTLLIGIRSAGPPLTHTHVHTRCSTSCT
jgi:hypothetical protein